MRLLIKNNKENSWIGLRIFCVFCGIWILFFAWFSKAQAATLSQLYGYLLEKNEFFLKQQVDFSRLEEDSHHASPAYDRFDSSIDIVFLDTALKFSPLSNTQILFGLRQPYPVDYSRNTYTPAGNLGAILNYDLQHFRDFTFQLRTRQGPFEPYVSLLTRRQKTNWTSSVYPDPPNYFAYIRTHYENLGLGLRYLSVSESQEKKESGFSLLRRPLLLSRQLNLDARLRYRKGTLRRKVDVPSLAYLDSYYQELESQYTTEFRLGYGLKDNLELTSGIEFSFPYKYRFVYRRNAETRVDGVYRLEDEFVMPLELRYRPLENAEILFSSDISYGQQKLDYWTSSDGTYADKELDYLNAQPSFTLAYLYEGDSAISQDRLSLLTKSLLSKGQCLFQFKYLRDITSLDKNGANGPQNKIDPHNIFLYPIDLFMAGTEFSTFYTGNKSDTSANVLAQNYNLFQLGFTYGLTDRFNASAIMGHRTTSRFHHFTVGGSSTFDLKSRYYVIKPYWFFSIPCDWRLGQNSLLSFIWYYVPKYRTDISIEGVAKEFKSKTYYYTISLALKVLF